MRLRATSCVLAPLLLTCLTVTACASTRTVTTTASAGEPRPEARRPALPVEPAAPRQPRIGTTQSVRVAGARIVVTIISVIDPLRGSRAAVPPGMKVVGVLASVRDAGPTGYDGSATSDFSLRSASGLASPVFVPAGPCRTQVQDFMNEIAADELRAGCVAFSIPKGQPPISVRFTPGGSSGHSRAWVVPGH